MAFYSSQVYEGKTTFISYIHSSGFDSVYKGNVKEAQVHLENNLKLIQKQIEGGNISPKDPKYGIAVVWGDSNESKRIDAFVYGNIPSWKENPKVAIRTFSNNTLIIANGIVACGDGLIMLGIEEEIRRTTKDLTNYLEDETRSKVKFELSKIGLWLPKGEN